MLTEQWLRVKDRVVYLSWGIRLESQHFNQSKKCWLSILIRLRTLAAWWIQWPAIGEAILAA